jgi:hypothetical protein
MRRNVELFINNQRVDLFDFEDINIVDSIQDVRDISKVFVPYSREFSVPASKNNNKIFKHYYNNDIVNGFDARFKISAVLKVNGVLYKTGKVTLLSANLKNNRASKYNLVFYASTIDLKTLIGDDMLTDLSGNYINSFSTSNSTHASGEFDSEFVKRGFESGWTLNDSGVLDDTTPIDAVNNPKDLIFPFISSNNYYYYDTANGSSPVIGDTESRNLNNLGVLANDLRGAIRLNVLMEAIGQKYGINLTGGFFDASNEQFNRLYIWLQDKKGLYETNKSAVFDFDDALTSGSPAYNPPALITESAPFTNIVNKKYALEVETKPLDIDVIEDEYRVRIINTEDSSVLLDSSAKGAASFTIELINPPSSGNVNKTFVIQTMVGESSASSFRLDYTLTTLVRNDASPYFGDFETVSTDFYSEIKITKEDYFISQHLPKLKIIDFLTSLFNMFNLTAYTDNNGDIMVQSLNEYYASGNIVDLTKFVDTEDIDVSRNEMYSQISFEYEKPSTLAIIESNILTKDEFGNEKIDNTNDDQTLSNILAFDGGKYEITPKFEKMQYSRIANQAPPAQDTRLCWGWSADDKQSPVLIKPLIFYSHYEDFSLESPSSFKWDYDEEGTPLGEFSGYYRPANTLSTVSSRLQSINFGSEYDEFHYSLGAITSSLFETYWKNYILSIYDKRSRITKLKAILPLSIANSIRLNDIIVINRKGYRINVLDVNITTGKASLELVTYLGVLPSEAPEFQPSYIFSDERNSQYLPLI